ncbi:MAG: deoxyguanosinetriphosphate triphosphohydrolase [Acidipila sp.]|nr:deoxyguanosinetriphosphate triphosphohydrolase [Acidipila sp.]
MKLASYAMDAAHSRGRRYPEPPHPYRNIYARDRDRVIHARAFRRLEAKTQVFTTRFSDHFRNRLTHTLEVAQIARTVAGALDLNSDLVEALALAHDIGHPPFGHAGEHKLDQLMRNFGETFEHNLHALRIVEKFEQRYLAFPGLNLTFEVREGIIKHSRDFSAPNSLELAEYLLDLRPPLEAQLIDLVDEIAYNTADLDDGRETGLLPLAVILSEAPRLGEIYQEIDRRYPEAREKLKFLEALKRILDALVTDLIDASRRNIQASGVKSLEDVRNSPVRLIGLSPEGAALSASLKKFLHARFYNHAVLVRERDRSVAALEEVFRYYFAHPQAMPEFYSEQAEREQRHRVVCDYIAGMTDRFLLRQQHDILRSATGD